MISESDNVWPDRFDKTSAVAPPDPAAAPQSDPPDGTNAHLAGQGLTIGDSEGGDSEGGGGTVAVDSGDLDGDDGDETSMAPPTASTFKHQPPLPPPTASTPIEWVRLEAVAEQASVCALYTSLDTSLTRHLTRR